MAHDKADTHLGLWLKYGVFELLEDENFVSLRRWVPPDIPAAERIDDLVVFTQVAWRSLVAQVRANVIYSPPIDQPISWQFFFPDGQSVVFENFTALEWHGFFEFLKREDLPTLARMLNLVRWPSVVKPSRQDLPGASRSTGPDNNHRAD